MNPTPSRKEMKTLKKEIFKLVRWYGGRPEDKFIAKSEAQAIDALESLFSTYLQVEAEKEYWRGRRDEKDIQRIGLD